MFSLQLKKNMTYNSTNFFQFHFFASKVELNIWRLVLFCFFAFVCLLLLFLFFFFGGGGTIRMSILKSICDKVRFKFSYGSS